MAFRLYGLWQDSRESPALVSQPQPATDEGTATDSASGVTPLERLVVRKLNREDIISVTDVDRVEADGNYVRVHAQGSSYPR